VIGIIDYGAGNTRSLQFALDRLGVPSMVSRRVDELRRVSKVILPGVGAARSAIAALEQSGVADFLRTTDLPLLGICLGMQLLFDTSDEWDTTCLGMMSGGVHRFASRDLKIPHMGWNRVYVHGNDPLMKGIDDGAYFYFVHSYFAPIGPESIASTHYGIEFCSAVARDNYHGVQFHPEKSGTSGMRVLANFVEHC